MLITTLLTLSAALAADPPGEVAYTDIETRSGWLHPAVLVGFNPQPEPPGDWQLDRYTATLSVPISERLDTSVLIGVGEERESIEAILLEGEREDVLVYGKGAEEKWLPPGPCFDLRVLFGDGSEMTVQVEIASSDGWLDPESLVGLNPQPEPPGRWAAIQLDLYAESEGKGTLDVTISVEHEGAQMPLY